MNNIQSTDKRKQQTNKLKLINYSIKYCSTGRHIMNGSTLFRFARVKLKILQIQAHTQHLSHMNEFTNKDEESCWRVL